MLNVAKSSSLIRKGVDHDEIRRGTHFHFEFSKRDNAQEKADFLEGIKF